ncbi:MAG TPA: methyl-accepting chemotaxis protein [Noviherbaspirillum sp.]|nr:methyl-accepting chemotaxis protein [Noviherbaspirillum sp.]
MRIGKLPVAARLGAGFGLVLLMMATMIAMGFIGLTQISAINNRLIEKEWVKADAANTINATIRANALRSFELLIASDKAETANIYRQIDLNKKTINNALNTLDKIVYLPEGKALMGKIKETRAQYVASFTKFGKMIEEGKTEQAIETMRSETLPILYALQDHIAAFVELQNRTVVTSGQDVQKNVDSIRMGMLILGALALFIGIVAAHFITRGLLKQLGGEPAQAAEVAGKIAAGDLAVTVETKANDQSSTLFAMKQMRDSLANIVGQVRHGTETIATASSQIAAGNLDLSARTEEQASSLEETASSMDEIIGTVKQNADNARQANQLALTAAEIASKGGAVVAEVVDTMGSIHDSSKRIVDIISVIEGIAFQTNILALNAAVEAARAGEQGRGFAVVATEVRSLAQRSSSAAKEIKSLIDDSVERVDAGAKLVDQAGATMRDIVASVNRVTDIMGEITAASAEQTTGIEHISRAISEMDKVTQQNAALVEEAATASASMQEQAADLARLVSLFRLDGMPALQPEGQHPPAQHSLAQGAHLTLAADNTKDEEQADACLIRVAAPTA